jgi:hypothetical protein
LRDGSIPKVKNNSSMTSLNSTSPSASNFRRSSSP